MAKNDFWESLKKELTPELSESARHFEQDYAKLIEELSENAHSKLKQFVKSCKPVPKGSSSLVVTIQSFMLESCDVFWVKVTGEYPNTPIVITDNLSLFTFSGSTLMCKGNKLELNTWHSASEFLDSSCILNRVHNKQFELREIFGNSYKCELPIVLNEQ